MSVVVHDIDLLREARLAKAQRGVLVSIWRDLMPCSCESYIPNDFGACVTCEVASTIIEKHGNKALVDFMESVRLGFADILLDKMHSTPFKFRKMRIELAEMAHKFKQRVKLPPA